MTPEERARADSVNEAISAAVRERKGDRPHAGVVSRTAPEATGSGFRYVWLLAFVLAANVAGFMAYRHYSETKQREADERISQIQAQVAADRAAENERAEALRASLAAMIAERQRLDSQTRAITNSKSKIDYNVVPARPAYPPARGPQIVREDEVPVQDAKPVDRSPAHAAVAIQYFRLKKGLLEAQVMSTEPVPGWDGRYRTELEVARSAYIRTTSPNPKRYEVLTQEKDGKITALEITTKGYY